MNLFHARILLPALLLAAAACAQDQPPPPAAPTDTSLDAQQPGGTRVFGVLPNYRAADASLIGTVLTPRQKFNIARKDSFDYPLVGLAAFFAGIGQLTNQQPSFGQGVKGYAHRWVTSYADQAMGNMFAEGLFPSLLHEDPRYFLRSGGTTKSRLGYAVSRVLVTYKDGGGRRFNYSEWLGNASAVAISNTYYPDTRTFHDNATKLLTQVATDAASQVLKEFWPDIKSKLLHKK